ncbi:hypothetical protein CDD81_388 [Ophiocordyceps australis]|uniref:Methyltransferase domain-containing protein n=1 Tax=Ophiocordyceps australis TaxID=1399860 RepID=A0A2C5XY83_9HYPO|nr:hypothetical protein CDD81_388 [Ophiocordyceps australis]
MASDSTYVLSRGPAEVTRLILQHFLWKKMYGYVIHPRIPVENPHLRIADIGTGTATWLLEVGESLPETVHLDGFDISLETTPPVGYLPSNMTLYSWNILDPVPQHAIEAYDIVHIRHFILVLDDTKAAIALDHLLQLMKPGGFLQWDEWDLYACRSVARSMSVSTDGHDELKHLTWQIIPHDNHKWITNCSGFLSDASLQIMAQETLETPAHLAWLSQPLIMETILSMKAGLKNQDGDTKEIDQIFFKVQNETKKGIAMNLKGCIVVCKKADAQEARLAD